MSDAEAAASRADAYRLYPRPVKFHALMPDASTARVLVIQTAFLGDVVLTTPLLEALAQRHGAVDVVTTPAAAPLVETHPSVRRVISYDKRGKDRGLSGFVRLGRALRAARYEAAFLPHRSPRSALLALLARVPRRIGFADGWPLLYTEARARPADGHEIDRLLALAEAPSGSFAPHIYPTPGDEQTAGAFLAAAGVGGAGGVDEFVTLAPGSIWGSKRWPYHEDLAGRLAPRCAVVVVGGPEDSAPGQAI